MAEHDHSPSDVIREIARTLAKGNTYYQQALQCDAEVDALVATLEGVPNVAARYIEEVYQDFRTNTIAIEICDEGDGLHAYLVPTQDASTLSWPDFTTDDIDPDDVISHDFHPVNPDVPTPGHAM